MEGNPAICDKLLDLEAITLNEISQTKKNPSYSNLHVGYKNIELKEAERKIVVAKS